MYNMLLDCYETYLRGLPLPGVYNLTSIGPVQCLADGWTTIQHRGQYGNAKDYFSAKNWADYEAGFGSPGKHFFPSPNFKRLNVHKYFISGNELWIGLENIYNLTNRPVPMELRIVMEDFSGTVKDAYYDTFRLEDKVCIFHVLNC